MTKDILLHHICDEILSGGKDEWISFLFLYWKNKWIEKDYKIQKSIRERKLCRADFVRMSGWRNGIVSRGSGRHVTTAWWITDGDGTVGRPPQCFATLSITQNKWKQIWEILFENWCLFWKLILHVQNFGSVFYGATGSPTCTFTSG